MITFYSDGSTRGKNQKGADNVGGWGAVCINEIDDGYEYELLDFDCDTNYGTTNNREELKGLLYCLAAADEYYPHERCLVYSDSAYVVNMCNDWIWTWARNGWKNSKKQTVENLDLVQAIYERLNQEFYHCIIRKCPGHNDLIGNELADALATGNFKRFMDLLNGNGLNISDDDYEWIQRKMEELAETR
jgi:ribonuclease HI